MPSKFVASRLIAVAFVPMLAVASVAVSVAANAQSQPAAATAATAESDAAIAAKVKAALQTAPALANAGIQVSCKDAVVVLAGNVSADAAQQAPKLAATVAGVKEVRSELKVQG